LQVESVDSKQWMWSRRTYCLWHLQMKTQLWLLHSSWTLSEALPVPQVWSEVEGAHPYQQFVPFPLL
jgi:hypothetical protein